MSHKTHRSNEPRTFNRPKMLRMLRHGSWKAINLLVVLAMLLPNFTILGDQVLAASESSLQEVENETNDVHLTSRKKGNLSHPLANVVRGKVDSVKELSDVADDWGSLLPAENLAEPPDGVTLDCTWFNQNTVLCDQLEGPYIHSSFQTLGNFIPGHANYAPAIQNVDILCGGGDCAVPVYFSMVCGVEWSTGGRQTNMFADTKISSQSVTRIFRKSTLWIWSFGFLYHIFRRLAN